MGKSSPTPPPAPDYIGAANAQGAANLTAGQQSASLSNPNINTPYGSQTVTYDQTGPNGDYQPTINQTLTPEAQATLSSQQSVQRALAGLGQQGIGQAQQILGQPFQYNGPGVQTSLNTSGVAKMPVNAGTTGQQAILSRLQPQIQQNEGATAQRLANQGIPVGSEAWNNEMRQQGNQENDLYTQAALQGIGLDTSANAQGFNQALQGAQFGNTATQQGLSQQLGLYNQPLNEITALMSGSQIQNPQFQGYMGSNIQAAPIANATAQQGQYAQNLYGQQMASYNSGMQGLSGLFGAGLGAIGQAGGAASFFSDIRLKSNIKRVGTHPLGIGIYEYDIFGHRERGVMAHEVEDVKPTAVSVHASGFKMVDYGALQ